MNDILPTVMMWLLPIIIFFVVVITVIKQYKICPNDQVMVIYGAGANSADGARVVHGGGRLVIPYLQSFRFMSLAPMSISVDLTNALSANNIRLSVPSQFTISIATKDPALMQNAVRYLLALDVHGIESAAKEIIIGSLRAVVAQLTIEELTRDRVKFIKAINDNVNIELNKIGICLLNVNIRDLQDSSGYIEAMGKRSASEAINKAQVEVSEQERIGKVGVETNKREQDVSVAEQTAQSKVGISTAERDRDVKTAALGAETQEGKNNAAATIAESNAKLAVREATAFQEGKVARARAETVVATEQRIATQAELAKEQLPAAEVAREQLVIESQAHADQIRITAQGEADSILLKFKAEAEGLKLVLEAKAAGYKLLIEAAGGNAQAAATLLMIEKMAEIVQIQSEALANIKIDKITVWDSGSGNDGVQGFIRNFAASLPPLQEIAQQAGIQLPSFMGAIAPVQPKEPEVLEAEQTA